MTSTTGRSAQTLYPTYWEILAKLAHAQKSASRSAPAYSRFVNRKLGRLIAAWAYRQGLRPNVVTAISAVFTFTGIGFLAAFPPSAVQGISVALLLIVGYAFDSADGQVARLSGRGSPAGEWLDHVVDATKVVVLPLALAIGMYRFDGPGPGWLLVPLASAVVSSVLFFGMILTEQLRRQVGLPTSGTGPGGSPSLLRSLLVLPMDYGVLCLSFFLLGVPLLFLAVYTVILAATTLFLVLALVKWYRELALNQATLRAGHE